jgi:hypothetical protein
MEHNKVSRPNGFPAEFYQTFWEVIKVDVMALFAQFANKRVTFVQVLGHYSLTQETSCGTNTTICTHLPS